MDEMSSPTIEDYNALSYNDFNKHSIVAYDIGYHVDVFGDKQPSLENKVVFGIRLLPGQGHGRGGKDGSMFHYALLDWEDNKKFWRQFLLTRNIIHPNQQADQGTLDNLLRLNPLMRNVYRRALANNDRTIRADRQQRRHGRGLNNSLVHISYNYKKFVLMFYSILISIQCFPSRNY